MPTGTRGPLREMHTQEEPHSSIQVWPNTRPSLRGGRTAYAVLSREPMLLSGLPHACGSRRHRAGWHGAASTRLDRGERRSGPHGFAVRVQRRSNDTACKAAHGGRLNPLPALPLTSAPALSASTASPTRVRHDVRSPLSIGPGWRNNAAFPNFGKVEYFCGKGLTGFCRGRVCCPTGNSARPREVRLILPFDCR